MLLVEAAGAITVVDDELDLILLAVFVLDDVDAVEAVVEVDDVAEPAGRAGIWDLDVARDRGVIVVEHVSATVHSPA